MMVAMPMPAPTHSVARPVARLRRSSSSSSVPRIMAPVAPSGWPIAIAPPLTFMRSCGTFITSMKRSTTEAKASFSSYRSMSEAFMPAMASAFSAA